MSKFLEVRMASDRDNDDTLGEGSAAPAIIPTVVDVEQIRNVHPRKYGKVGTRIVFKNGSAMPVLDLYPDIVRAWTDGALATTWTPPAPPAVPVEDEEDMDAQDNVVSMGGRPGLTDG